MTYTREDSAKKLIELAIDAGHAVSPILTQPTWTLFTLRDAGNVRVTDGTGGSRVEFRPNSKNEEEQERLQPLAFSIGPVDPSDERDVANATLYVEGRLRRLFQVVSEMRSLRDAPSVLVDENRGRALSWILLEATDVARERTPDFPEEDAAREVGDILLLATMLDDAGVTNEHTQALNERVALLRSEFDARRRPSAPRP